MYLKCRVVLREKIGKEQENAKQLLALVGALLLFNTGCRPNEAAYMAYNFKDVIERVQPDVLVFGAVKRQNFKIKVPAEFTKTYQDYTFYFDSYSDIMFLWNRRTFIH